MKTQTISWIVFSVFVALAIWFNQEPSFVSQEPYALGKYVAWLGFALFTAYTYYCSSHENLFKTIKTMNGLYWGRQIGTDLYIGLILFMGLIYLHQGSLLVAALWLLPVLAFANLATLLYVALHYDSLMQLILK